MNSTMMSASEPLIEPQDITREGGYGAITRDGEEPAQEHRRLSQESLTHLAPNRVQLGKGPNSYMCYAILSAIFCCFPLGIPAVYYSFKVREHSKKMDWPKARKAAFRSRYLIQMAVSLGMVLWFLGLVVFIAITKPRA
ncbi:uncharacterized protein [Haliotis cracherodii]|uniref:uncharacterized protein n=1 Tax=Haliotis cracherodii TaxID=6455 RepID=UPI0039ED1D46